MYSILLVDDERNVVNCLASDVDWEELHIHEVHKADSSAAALTFLEKNKVDVVICDIRMPGMNGIEMSRIIYERWRYIKIIFLSEYDDFNYAREALSLKVYDYITKPIDYDRVKACVAGALAELDGEYKMHGLMKAAEQMAEEARPILAERYLNRWICHGQYAPDIAKDNGQEGTLSIHPEWPVLLTLVRVDQQECCMDAGHVEMALKGLIRDVLCKQWESMCFVDRYDNFVVFMQAEEDELNAMRKYIYGIAETFQQFAKYNLKCVVSLFLADQICTPRQAHEVYLNLRNSSTRARMVRESGVIYLQDQETQYVEDPVGYLKDYPSLNMLVSACDESKAVEKLRRSFEMVRVYTGERYSGTLFRIYQTVSVMITRICSDYGVEPIQYLGAEERFLYNYSSFTSDRTLENWCIRVVRMMVAGLQSSENKHTSALVRRVENQLHMNMHLDISVTELASQFYVHPNHLSRVFKKATGMSIIDYVNRLRIDKAKELLKNPSKRVFEVAVEVGFVSTAYFTRLFKRAEGMTPKEYQNACANAE